MGGGRQAWCPRCDEVRAARPGAGCPACGRQLLAVPPARPGQPQPRPAARLAGRLRALAPAAGAVGIALLVLAVVASAFATGRLTRTTPSAPAAAPTATTTPGAGQDPRSGRRDFNWEARAAGVVVKLRSVTVGTGYSRLELHVDGVPRGREISSLERLRIRDRDGKDLLAGGELASIAAAASRPATEGGMDTEVVLDRPIDREAVASLQLGGVTVGREVTEELHATLTDPELRRLMDNGTDEDTLAGRRGCPGCRLRVVCPGCRTIRVTGSAYRHNRVVIALEALGPVGRTALNPSRRRVIPTDEFGASELPAWIDGSGGDAVITMAADQLAGRLGGPTDMEMAFKVTVESLAEQAIRGNWTLRQGGG
jgi:hypothetical protein